MKRATFLVRGVVQGVGFRPYVYRLAGRHHLTGTVSNTSAQVVIDVQGEAADLAAFADALPAEAPALAQVLDVEQFEEPVVAGQAGFVIVPSTPEPGVRTIVPPDTALCADCLRELFDPADRRYLHPFITCTNCGPRFTIICDLPYDRPNTTMAHLPMCDRCAAEYSDPADRRFHAQPIACPDCGPTLTLTFTRTALPPPPPPHPVCAPNASSVRNTRRHAQESDQLRTDRPAPGSSLVAAAAEVLADGGVLAVKGLGGFHLACDASNEAAVSRLRERKAREAKPLAVMVPDLATAREICDVTDAEARELTSPAAPIVLLRRRAASSAPACVADGVAPGNAELGVMIAYTPIHHLLFRAGAPRVLVMTSGNLSGEPICFRDEDAPEKLGGVADAILGHDRPIVAPCDDSVVRVMGEQVHPLRRSRGYAPLPLHLSTLSRSTAGLPAVLAVGGELKATACLFSAPRAYLSQHLGDMESLAGQEALAQAARHLATLYDIQPAAMACDLHPDYHSTRWAQRNHGSLPLVQVQHHHAHAVSLLAEHDAIGRAALVFSFDGTGYGTDGAIWGGEVLRIDAEPSDWTRVGHLREVRLPGGDAAVAEPWRIALAHLAAAGIRWDADLPCVQAAGDDAPRVRQLLGSERATTPCTSIGRLFDAVSSLLGVCHHARYEGQAAIELEQVARAATARTTVARPTIDGNGLLQPGPLLAALVEGLRRAVPTAELAYAFHAWIADAVAAWAVRERANSGIGLVGLTGGVFANALLSQLCAARLTSHPTAGSARHLDPQLVDDVELLTHRHVPAGDGGIALGQAVIAAHQLARAAHRPAAATAGRN